MSLKVWLPLDGTLKNNGSSDAVVTNSGSTVNTLGKIGSCYSFDGSDDYISLNCSDLYNVFKGGTQPFSIAMWVYHADTTRAILFGDFSLSGSVNFNIELTTGHVVRFYWNANPDYSTSINVGASTWTHITLVYNGTTLKQYNNGVLVGSRDGVLASLNKTSGVFYLGRDSRTGATALNGRLNDLRIYDHALSTAEVHEIAQGLVLHYKLDVLNNNMLNRTPKLYSSGSYNAYQLQLTENLVANQAYTLQFWDINVSHTGKTADTLGISVYWGGGSVTLATRNGTSYFSNGHCDYMVIQFTPSSSQASGSGATNAWLNIYNSVPSVSGTMAMSIGAWKLEKGSIATPFSGTVAECGNVVYDSSGYGHHGTIIGIATMDASSSRFNNAVHMTNTSTTNHIENGFEISTIQTVSLWVKSSKSNQVIFADRTSNIEFGIYGNLGTYTTDAGKALFDLTNYIANEWNHVVVMKDGTTYRMFINGIERATTSTTNYYTHSTSLWLLNRNANNSYAADASISDFRAYCTILSEDDIYELYKVETKVDRSKEIHAYAFDEKGSRELIAGQIWTNSYSVHTNTPCTTIVNGEYTLTGSKSISTPYIPIAPTGHTYQYDIEISTDASNVFYIGFERYDKDKTARSNNACVYLTGMNGTPSERIHQRYRGTVDLSTDGVNPCAFIALRILNDWSSPNSRKATIHKFSLREISTVQTPTINNTGVFDVDELDERSKASFYKNGFVEATEFIEI